MDFDWEKCYHNFPEEAEDLKPVVRSLIEPYLPVIDEGPDIDWYDDLFEITAVLISETAMIYISGTEIILDLSIYKLSENRSKETQIFNGEWEFNRPNMLDGFHDAIKKFIKEHFTKLADDLDRSSKFYRSRIKEILNDNPLPHPGKEK